jgi:CubicO group peptidase (beta-lactamase class C family)
VRDLMTAYGAPGAAVAVTDRDRTLAVRTYGFAEIAARSPVLPETLFEIGSIGKSFTAACLMQLAEEGRVDLRVPVTDYLPWFAVRSRFAPITLHHLLTHTAGIITGSDITSDSRFDVWALRESEAGAPPGERFQYSNVGYRVLGFVLEEIEGRPYGEILRSRVLEPSGMSATEPVITNAIRHRLAIAYMPHPDDRPVRYEVPLAPATWLETGTGDGSVASTAADMAAYLRVWLNRGRGVHGRVVSEESFERMIAGPGFEFEPGSVYGYGLVRREVDGRRYLGHGGDMVGYASAMHGEPETGYGVVVLTNCLDWEDWAARLAREVLGWLRCESLGEPLPEPPPAPDLWRVENADDYAGSYEGDSATLTVTAEGGSLFIDHQGARIQLERRPDDQFLVDHPDFELFLVVFERRDGRVVAASHGPRRWRRDDRDETSPQSPLPDDHADPDAAAYPGHYRSTNPWTTNFRVVNREGQLLLILPRGSEEPLVPLGGGSFRVGEDERAPERLRFDAVVNGAALRANLSGCDYYRAFTP